MWSLRCWFSHLFSHKYLDSHQISVIADLNLLNGFCASVRRKRVFRNCTDFFMGSEEWPRRGLLDLCRILERHLRRESRRSNARPMPLQLLSTLGVFGYRDLSAQGRELVRHITAHSQENDARSIGGYKVPFSSVHPICLQWYPAFCKGEFYEITGLPYVIGVLYPCASEATLREWLHIHQLQKVSFHRFKSFLMPNPLS